MQKYSFLFAVSIGSLGQPLASLSFNSRLPQHRLNMSQPYVRTLIPFVLRLTCCLIAGQSFRRTLFSCSLSLSLTLSRSAVAQTVFV